MTLSTPRERVVVAALGFAMLPIAVVAFTVCVFAVMGYFAVALFGSLLWPWFPSWGFLAMVLLAPVVAYLLILLAKRVGRFISEGN